MTSNDSLETRLERCCTRALYDVLRAMRFMVVPKDVAVEAAPRTEEVMLTEYKVRTAILAGTNPQEAYLKCRKF